MMQVLPDAEALSRKAADLFVAHAQQAVEERGRFRVALSGGHTPRRLYELLAAPPFRDRIQWERIQVFWGDERCVPEGDERRNALMAHRALLDHVPVTPDRIYPIACHDAPHRSAIEYADLLHAIFSGAPPTFDLVLLGLGENGHTASLFPNTVILKDTTSWTAALYLEDQDMYRMTLMPAVINQALQVVFLVSGGSKAAVLKEVYTGPRNPLQLPAQLICPVFNETLWLVDEAAARQIQG